MSIAAQCPDCCTCPTATVEWDSRSASAEICGFSAFTWPTDKTIWRTCSLTGFQDACSVNSGVGDCSDVTNYTINSFSGSGTITGCPAGIVSASKETREGTGCTASTSPVAGSQPLPLLQYDFSGFERVAETITITETTYRGQMSGTTCAISSEDPDVTALLGGDWTNTLSNKVECAEVERLAVADLPAYDDDWNDTEGSFLDCSPFFSPAKLSVAIRESRYRLRFKIPLVRTGKCYRLEWVERFIPEAGVGITSVEVFSRGVYRPTVTLSAPPSGGTQARAVAVMSSTGTVSSIRILNPGSGYVSAPTVTVQTAINGGTTSTGWTATLTAGQVTAISGGSAGDYRPTLSFSGGGGSGATATCTVDSQGGIDAVTITNAGSAYTSEPSLSISSKVSGFTAADLLLHLGTETEKTWQWAEGDVPPGYDPDDSTTWPVAGESGNGYFELPVPSADGTTLVANIRAVCSGCEETGDYLPIT